ncbi:MAG: HEAT repeat domain-containing protein [Asgard group archaeon]|nr:HEAT repeat domain-containing protein [Asgard group archaeon]
MDLKKIEQDLKSRNTRDREDAVDQLALLQDPTTIPLLLKVLKTDKQGSVRRRVALALGRIGDESCADELYEVLVKEKDSETKRNAAIALGSFGDERAILPLYEFYTAPKKNNFFDSLDRARVNKVLTELAQKKARKSIEDLVEWRKERVKKE